MQTNDYYKIGNQPFRVIGSVLNHAIEQMSGFSTFICSKEQQPVFELRWIEEFKILPRLALYSCEAEGVVSSFFSVDDGYALDMVHFNGARLCVWMSTEQHVATIHGCLEPIMLRFALWIAYGVMNASLGKIPIHGSCIVNAGKAYLFLGESGTGKSTHTRLWREHIPGSFLLNDDSPIISVEEDGIWIYGSPWSGKTPCYRQERYPLCGCVRLSQAPFNKIKKLNVLQAYAAVHPSCPPEFAYDEVLYEGISASLTQILEHVPIYHLQCLPDAAAAQLSYQTMSAYDN